MSSEVFIHYFQTEDEEWMCAVQEPHVYGDYAMKEQVRALAADSSVPEHGEEHLAILARIAIHHAMKQLGAPEKEFKLEFLPPVVKTDAPGSLLGASILDLFEWVTVWRLSGLTKDKEPTLGPATQFVAVKIGRGDPKVPGHWNC